MKDQFKLFGIIVAVVAIGFSMTACDDLLGSGSGSSSGGSGGRGSGSGSAGVNLALYGWYGTGYGTHFTISNANQLRGLSNIVRGVRGEGTPPQNDFRGQTITLTADINLDTHQWRAIGWSYIPTRPFNGTFDGNNRTISNFYTNNQNGFFGLIGEHGTVRNITFNNFNVVGSDGVGGLTRVNNGVVDNITIINGDVRGTHASGIAMSNRGTIQNSSFSGTIVGSGNVGGIASSNSGMVRNCTVTGTVTGNTASSGIVGIVGSNTGFVENSYFFGN